MHIDTNKTLSRAYDAEISHVDEENKTVTLSFSSEAPVQRNYGSEVLSHDEGAVNLERMTTAPLLWNHNHDVVLGKVVKANIVNGRGEATVKWSSRAAAKDYWGDVREGILSNVSVGYKIDEYTPITEGKKAIGIRATRWTPYEISILGVPADNSVGIGRSLDEPEVVTTVEETEPQLRSNEVYATTLVSNEVATQEITNMSEVDINEVRAQELDRIRAIQALGTQFQVPQDEVNKMIEGDKSIADVRGIVLDRLKSQAPNINPAPELGLSKKEKRSFSIAKLALAMAEGRPQDAGLEFEASRALEAQNITSKHGGIVIPLMDIETRANPDYLAQTFAQGGALVQTELHQEKFIEYLYNKSSVMQLGATMLSGLQGNIAIPKQNGTSTTYWLNPEGADITESGFPFSQIMMTPKVLGARSQWSYLAMRQPTLDIESLIRADFQHQISLAMDLAALSGSGTGGVPLGIINQPGVNTLSLGTNGGALTFKAITDLIKTVEQNNALIGDAGFLTNARVKYALMNTLKSTGDTASNYIMQSAGDLLGTKAVVSEQVSSAYTKGTGTNLSALIFGVWSELYIGTWSTAEILVNPYGAGFNSGSIDIRIMASMDTQVRHPQSFSLYKDIVAA